MQAPETPKVGAECLKDASFFIELACLTVHQRFFSALNQDSIEAYDFEDY